MLEDLKKEFSSIKLLTALLCIAVGIYLFQILSQVIGIFSDIILISVCAWLLSFILEPLAIKVGKVLKISIAYSALLVYLFFAGLFIIIIFLFIPVVNSQLQTLSAIIPDYLSNAPKSIQVWAGSLTSSFDNIASYIPSVAQFLIDILLTLILSFYLIVDKQRINEELYNLAPKNWHKNLKFIQNVINETVASFLRIQLIFAILAGITAWIVLTIFGVQFAASTSLIAGVLSIIPLVGPVIGIIPAAFVTLISDPANPTKSVLVFAILLLAQQITFNALAPKLFSKAFKLHPIIVFMSFLVGYKVAGAPGAIFAVPVLGIITIIFKELGHYFINPKSQ